MKKSVILIAICLVSVSIIAQNSKLIAERVDDMTNAKIVETKYVSLNKVKLFNPGADFMIKFRKVDDNIIIDLRTTCNSVFSILKDEELMLKLSNDSVLKFKNCEYGIASPFSMSGVTIYTLENRYYSEINKIEMLSNFQLKKIRVYLSDSYFEREIKPDLASKFQELSKAFYEKIK